MEKTKQPDYIIPAKFFNGKYRVMRMVNLDQWRKEVGKHREKWIKNRSVAQLVRAHG